VVGAVLLGELGELGDEPPGDVVPDGEEVCGLRDSRVSEPREGAVVGAMLVTFGEFVGAFVLGAFVLGAFVLGALVVGAFVLGAELAGLCDSRVSGVFDG
jgi:hypothetical protein